MHRRKEKKNEFSSRDGGARLPSRAPMNAVFTMWPDQETAH